MTKTNKIQMDFSIALQAVKRAKRITRVSWPEDYCLELHENETGAYLALCTYTYVLTWAPEPDDLLATDWTLYT